MRSQFWTFLEACDETQSLRALRELFAATMRGLGCDTWALLTHAPFEDLRSLGVALHNWPQEAIDLLFDHRLEDPPNPLFEAVERTKGPVHWRSSAIKRNHRAWFKRLRELLDAREGVSVAMRSTIVDASCSITAGKPFTPDDIKLFARIAEYAHRQVLVLQRPQLSEAEQLTTREHEFLYRATVLGERPADVSQQLGVKISTVRTLRQKANVRLDAGSQEQAAWRMLETRQLFRSGRKGRPRAW